MVSRGWVSLIINLFEKGEINYPNKVKTAFVYRRASQFESQQSKNVHGALPVVRHQETYVAFLGLELGEVCVAWLIDS